jgi:hypothetical protein
MISEGIIKKFALSYWTGGKVNNCKKEHVVFFYSTITWSTYWYINCSKFFNKVRIKTPSISLSYEFYTTILMICLTQISQKYYFRNFNHKWINDSSFGQSSVCPKISDVDWSSSSIFLFLQTNWVCGRLVTCFASCALHVRFVDFAIWIRVSFNAFANSSVSFLHLDDSLRASTIEVNVINWANKLARGLQYASTVKSLSDFHQNLWVPLSCIAFSAIVRSVISQTIGVVIVISGWAGDASAERTVSIEDRHLGSWGLTLLALESS